MRTQDRDRRDVIRQIETEVAVARSEPGFSGEVDDDLYRRVISSYVKKMDKARGEYLAAGERGAAMAAKLGYEVCLLEPMAPISPSARRRRFAWSRRRLLRSEPPTPSRQDR